MNLITIIQKLEPIDFVYAEKLSEIAEESGLLEWIVREKGVITPVSVFSAVRKTGMFCSACRGIYPKDVCIHTAAVFMRLREDSREERGLCDINAARAFRSNMT